MSKYEAAAQIVGCVPELFFEVDGFSFCFWHLRARGDDLCWFYSAVVSVREPAISGSKLAIWVVRNTVFLTPVSKYSQFTNSVNIKGGCDIKMVGFVATDGINILPTTVVVFPGKPFTRLKR